jgi:hypothetical protein
MRHAGSITAPPEATISGSSVTLPPEREVS